MLEAIHHYFSAKKEHGLEGFSQLKGYLGEALFQHPDANQLKNADVAIIGFDETRGAHPVEFETNSNDTRYWLYQLSAIPKLKLVDLGNIKPGNTLNDSYAALKTIIDELLNANIIPVLIGGSNELSAVIVEAMASKNQSADYALIDSRFDVAEKQPFNSQSYLNYIIERCKKNCKGNIVGYQSYFITDEQFNFLDDNNFDLVRLGNVRSQLNELEPLLRDCDFVSFDMSAVRQADCPASAKPGPNGLYTEEACQLATFAGLSDRLKGFAIHECTNKGDINGISNHLVAQILWHLFYGISQRKGDYPAKSLDQYKKIYVKLDRLEFDLVFYQNEQNNRYWVEIPFDNNQKKRIVSCSEPDYIALCHNQIPDRIWRNIRMTMKNN
jgi:formiminoglutamase